MATLLDFFAHWDQVRDGLLNTLDLFSDEEMYFIPHVKSWPVGQILLHIASAEAGWIQYVLAGALDAWPVYPMEDHPTCHAIRTRLIEVHTKTIDLLTELTLKDLDRKIPFPEDKNQTFDLGWIIWHVLEHEIHHRGELSLALGLLGRDGLDV